MNDPIQLTVDVLCRMPLPKPEAGSKEGRGQVLVVAGSVEVPGAALLAATSALRAGAGKLQVARSLRHGTSAAVTLSRKGEPARRGNEEHWAGVLARVLRFEVKRNGRGFALGAKRAAAT